MARGRSAILKRVERTFEPRFEEGKGIRLGVSPAVWV